MSDKFKGEYRIESARLKHWDYGWNAAYFVTICTQNKVCFFGDVVKDKMISNDIGKMAHDVWVKIPEHFPFVKLGNHVIMPNHVHGIVLIDKQDDGRNVETRLIASLPTPPNDQLGGITGHKNPMLHDNLSKIIRWYKGRTSFESRKIRADFQWQSRFHDHIIRNDESFQKISEYIMKNPINWANDPLR